MRCGRRWLIGSELLNKSSLRRPPLPPPSNEINGHNWFGLHHHGPSAEQAAFCKGNSASGCAGPGWYRNSSLAIGFEEPSSNSPLSKKTEQKPSHVPSGRAGPTLAIYYLFSWELFQMFFTSCVQCLQAIFKLLNCHIYIYIFFLLV